MTTEKVASGSITTGYKADPKMQVASGSMTTGYKADPKMQVVSGSILVAYVNIPASPIREFAQIVMVG